MTTIATHLDNLNAPVNLHDHDLVSVSSSGGKDSEAQLALIVALADRQGYPRERIVVVHSDLGRMEWDGSHEIMRAQAEHYGLRVIVVKRSQGDLFDAVAQRAESLYQKWLRVRDGLNARAVAARKPKKIRKRRKGSKPRKQKPVELATNKLVDTTSAAPWYSSAIRYCTADHKRAQIFKVWTALVKEVQGEKGESHRVRILDCIGLRAEESPARAKKHVLARRTDASNGKRDVWTWLPILHFSTEQVWETIAEAGLPVHRAYELGMPRLSCVFCCFAPKTALLLAAYHNREKLALAVELEEQVGWSFKVDLSFAQIQAELDAGWEPKGKVALEEWEEGGKSKTAKPLPLVA